MRLQSLYYIISVIYGYMYNETFLLDNPDYIYVTILTVSATLFLYQSLI